MRRSGLGRSGARVLLGASLISALPATPVEAEEPAARALNTVLFGSLDVGRSGFANVGFKRSLVRSIETSGPIALAGIGAGASPESSHGDRGRSSVGAASQAHVLLGYQWIDGPVTLAGLVGPELDSEDSGDRPGDRSRTRLGLRGHVEVWAHPTPETLVAATAIAGSARDHLWTRAAAGYAFWKGMFAGPEVSLYRTEDYREWRFGGHVTGLSWGRLNLRLSAGFLRVEDDRSGAYLGVTGYIRM